MILKCTLINKKRKEFLYDYVSCEEELLDLLEDVQSNLEKGNQLILEDISNNEKELNLFSNYRLNDLGF